MGGGIICNRNLNGDFEGCPDKQECMKFGLGNVMIPVLAKICVVKSRWHC